MKIKKFIVKFAIAIAMLFSSTRDSQAAIIVGGTGFVTQAHGQQLESWLGEGPITIANVFTKVSGSTNYDFHNAANEIKEPCVTPNIGTVPLNRYAPRTPNAKMSMYLLISRRALAHGYGSNDNRGIAPQAKE